VSQTIAIFNQAGGVGKTTLTMNIGYHLAQLKKKVLLLDLDPQASLTVFFGLKTKELSKTIYESLVQETPLPIYSDIHGMDLVPANIDLSAVEKTLADAIMKELRLKNALNDLQDKYDFILIDCPPSLGFLSIMSLIASTHVLVPIQTQYKAIMGTQQLIDTIKRVRKYGNSKVKLAGVVPTMFDSRAKQEQESLKRIQKAFSQTTVWSPISRATDFVNASQAHVPFAHYSPKHPSVEILETIAKDLIEAN